MSRFQFVRLFLFCRRLFYLSTVSNTNKPIVGIPCLSNKPIVPSNKLYCTVTGTIVRLHLVVRVK